MVNFGLVLESVHTFAWLHLLVYIIRLILIFAERKAADTEQFLIGRHVLAVFLLYFDVFNPKYCEEFLPAFAAFFLAMFLLMNFVHCEKVLKGKVSC